jgi:hypothetical protein
MAAGPKWDLSELRAFDKRLDAAPKKVERLGIVVTKDSAKRMVQEAKGRHPWQNRKGWLQSDIRVIRSGAFEAGKVGAEWGVDSQRRGKVGAILEATGWEWIGKAFEKYESQWYDRIRKVAVTTITRR